MQEGFLGEKYVQKEKSLGEKNMNEKYVQEGFLGEESGCKKGIWVKSL